MTWAVFTLWLDGRVPPEDFERVIGSMETQMEQSRHFQQAHRLQTAQIEDTPIGGYISAGAQKGIDHIIDKTEVAFLLPVAINLNFSTLDRKPDKPGDKALAIVL